MANYKAIKGYYNNAVCVIWLFHSWE